MLSQDKPFITFSLFVHLLLGFADDDGDEETGISNQNLYIIHKR